MTNRNVRLAAILLIALAAVVGALQLSATTAEAYGCSGNFKSCLGYCAGEGSDAYGSYGACRNSCKNLYCDY